MFLLNSLFAAALLFAYLLPFIPPKTFALLSVLSLGVPLLIIINTLFLLYWLLGMKKQAILPLIVLLLGMNHLTSVYEFSASEEGEKPDESISVMSYNVRQFNQFRWSDDIDIPGKLSRFIAEENPDILSMQEYYKGELDIALAFPHKYIKQKAESAEFGLAIFSKYHIINSGSLDFPTPSNNNGIFADVVVHKDTIRIINVHLQSFTVKPQIDQLEKQEHNKRVFLGMGQTFVRQQEQMNMVLDLIEKTPHRTLVMGDFNNTAYSYIYREMRSRGFNDSYKEEGNGFGRTFDFDYFPLRIDYIFVEESIEILSFETYQVHFSDHFPIRATIKL